MKLEFDAAKLASNVAKHGIWFAQVELFEFETAIYDVVRVGRESRIVFTGLVDARVHVLVGTLRGDALRIISFRRASKKEALRYVNR